MTHLRQADTLSYHSLPTGGCDYRELFDASPVPGWVYDRETRRILAVNDAAVHQYGYSHAEFLTLTLDDLRPAEDVPALAAGMAAEINAAGDMGIWRHRHKDGSVFPVRVYCSDVCWQGGTARVAVLHPAGGASTGLPSAAPPRASLDALAIFDSITDGFVILDRDGRFTFLNRQAEGVLGRPRAELLGRVSWEAFPDADGLRFVPELRRALRDQVSVAFEEDYPPLGVRVELWAYPSQLGLCVFFRDVTGRHRERESLRASEARLGAIIGSTMDAIVCVDGEHRIVVFNPAAEQMFRCPAAEALGSPLDRFLPPRFRTGHAEHLRAFGGVDAASLTPRVHGVLWGLRADGEEFPMEATLSQAEVGGCQLYTAVIRDVSERVRAEEALRESEARFRTLANSAPVLVWMSDAAGECAFVSRAWLEATGRTLQQARGKGWLECIHPEDRVRLAPQHAAAVATRARFEFEYRLLQRDGSYRWVLDAGRPLFGPDGEFAGYVGSCADIHSVRDAEEARERLRREQEGAAARQRAFLRDVLFSVTEGRLQLCEGPSDLPAPLPLVGEPIPITLPELATVRRRVREAAAERQFADVRLFDIMSAASECAMNSVQHGGGGALARVCAGPDRLQVWIEDRGKGIDLSDLPKATLLKGHSGAGGFGHGFFLMLQACDNIYLLTGPAGTTIVLEQAREEPPERSWPSF